MVKYFDVDAALAEIEGNPIRPIYPIPEAPTSRTRTNRTNRVPPDVEKFEERAAIIEFDAGLPRPQAEQMAAQAQGYDNVIAFRTAVTGQKDEDDT